MPPEQPFIETSVDPSVAEFTTGQAVSKLDESGLASDAELSTGLSGKADVNHSHDDRYYKKDEVDTALSGKSNTSHTHSGFAASSHHHDERYYQESEIDIALASKSNTNHTHSNASQSQDGFMAALDKLKLDGIKYFTARLQTNAAGQVTWNFPEAFTSVPKVLAVVEGASGSTDLLNVQLNGNATATQASFRVNRNSPTVVALLGLTILSTPASVGQQWIHVAAFQ